MSVQPGGLIPAEILHIDTAGSQDFFKRLNVNQSEKCECQRFLSELFSNCCQEFEGNAHWGGGDGGHAIFDATRQNGNAIKAAMAFLGRLPVLTQQTTTVLGRRVSPDQAQRRFRIKAHFGLVRIGQERSTDSSSDDVLDYFLKHERSFAPVVDEFFITNELWSQLSASTKDQFGWFSDGVPLGPEKTTKLYRLKWTAPAHCRDIFELGLRPQDLTDSEWQYLKRRILSLKRNVVARNSITTNLIREVSGTEGNGTLTGETVTKLTMQALYNYLRTMYQHYSFGVSIWRPNSNGDQLEKVAVYPAREFNRRAVSREDVRFMVVRAFNSVSTVVTPCVNEARLTGDWVDFDSSQSHPSRRLHSAIQLPIYRTRKQYGDYRETDPLAVLSIETEKPDFFRREDVVLWTDEFVGYLANFSLAESLLRAKHISTV